MTIKKKKPLSLRHELKHTINLADDMMISSGLRKLFSHDENADSRGVYRVSSLYFDTPGDEAMRQKMDGVNMREKFRLRYYNGDLSFLRLEKKMKINGLCAKQSAVLSLEQARELLCGDIDFLLHSGDTLLIELYSKIRGKLLKPRTVVTYEREAFLYPQGNVRITLDRDLRSGLGSLSFLDPQTPLVPVSDGFTVLEVKYDSYLPEIVRMAVQIPNRRSGAYSKYTVCRRYD